MGGGCIGGGSDGGSMGGGSEDRRSEDRGYMGGGFALGTAWLAVAAHARALAAADCASGFMCLPDCSPALYGLFSAVCLQLGSPMCCTISVLSTLPFFLLPCFDPICAAVSGQDS